MDGRAFQRRTPRRGAVSLLLAFALHAGVVVAMMDAEAPASASARQLVPIELVTLVSAGAPVAAPQGGAELSSPAAQAALPRAAAPTAPRRTPAAPPLARRAQAPALARAEVPEPEPHEIVAAAVNDQAGGVLEAVHDATGAPAGAGNVLGSMIGGSRGAGSFAGGLADPDADAGGGNCTRCDRSHGPRLLKRRDPCAGLFPWQAEADEGTVTMRLAVTPRGVAHHPEVLAESPRGHGFGRAAASCLSRMRFEPATDRSGKPVASSSVVRLRFAREP
ncbi:MAG TPA: energy transducer TonB [Polyangiaceae bacterium]|nr:energy transducer TonB [Polyangiaceae bacterium]